MNANRIFLLAAMAALAVPAASAASFTIDLPQSATLRDVQSVPGLGVRPYTYSNHTAYLVTVRDPGLVGYTIEYAGGERVVLFGTATESSAPALAALLQARNDTAQNLAGLRQQQANLRNNLSALAQQVSALHYDPAPILSAIGTSRQQAANESAEALAAVAGLNAQETEIGQIMPAVRTLQASDADQAAALQQLSAQNASLMQLLEVLLVANFLAFGGAAYLWWKRTHKPPEPAKPEVLSENVYELVTTEPKPEIVIEDPDGTGQTRLDRAKNRLTKKRRQQRQLELEQHETREAAAKKDADAASVAALQILSAPAPRPRPRPKRKKRSKPTATPPLEAAT